jgi:YD repeat-containing protein
MAFKRTKSWVLALCLGLLVGRPAGAQSRVRLADPPVLPVAAYGWDVKVPARSLRVTAPVQTLPGFMPVPLSVRMSAAYSQEKGQTYTWDPNNPSKQTWQPCISTLPIYACVHFGYVTSQALYSGAKVISYTVLEDGQVYSSADFGTGTALSASFLQLFGLSGSPSKGLPTSSNDALLASYLATAADLGSLASAVQSVNPVGFGTAPTSWQVVLTSQKARVMAYLGDFNAFVPVLWADKFGHRVSFQWTKTTSGLPSGVSAIYSVKILNLNPHLAANQTQGLLAQWIQSSGPGDVFRADFINVDAPSVRIQGLGCAGGTPASMDSILATYGENVDQLEPQVGGAVFVPTSITIGQQSHVPVASWINSSNLPTAASNDPSQNFTPQTWTFTYDAYYSTLTSLQEPNGLTTAFQAYELYTISLANMSVSSTTFKPSSMDVYGLKQALSTDSANSLTRTRSWIWGTTTTGATGLVLQDYFGAAPVKEICLQFAPLASLGSAYGNGDEIYKEIRDPLSKALAETVTYTTSTVGTDGTYTANQTVATAYPDGSEPRSTLVRTFAPNTNSLQVASETRTAGTGNTTVSVTNYTASYLPSFLEPNRVTSTTVTSYDSKGTALSPQSVTTCEFDNGASLGPGLLTRAYQDGGTLGQVGTTITHDSDGRPYTVSATNSNVTTPIRTKTYTYDNATGSLAKVVTSYAAALGTSQTNSVTWTATAFDTMGRPTRITDENGVVTTTSYDTRGRLLSQTVSGLPTVTTQYPDEATVKVTQSGVTATTLVDQFHRALRQKAADGTGVAQTYDGEGRLASRWVIATDGVAQGAATWTYDLLGRLKVSINPGGKGTTTQYAYAVSSSNAALAQVTSTVDPSGIQAVRTSSSTILGQVVSATDPVGAVTTLTYNGLGNTVGISVTDPALPATPQVRTFAFDALGRCTSKTSPETGTTTFSAFDALGHPTTVTEASGRVCSSVYDGLGRLVKVLNGSDSRSWTFTGLQLTANASSSSFGPTITQSFQYLGPAAALSQEQTVQPDLTATVNYTYDANGRPWTVQYPNGMVATTSYDALNRIVGVSYGPLGGGTAVVSAIQFNTLGQRQRVIFGSTAYSDVTTKDGGTHLDTWTVGYVAGGLTDTATPRVYAYDSAERLIKAGEWGTLGYDSKNRLVTANASAFRNVSTTLRQKVA